MPATARGADRVTLRGTVQTVFFASAGFSAGKLRGDDGRDHSFAGKMFIREGERLVLHGKWGRHAKYGEQFEADGLEYDVRLSNDGLAHYLASHPEIKGIGPVKARKIVELFGDAFQTVLTEEPGRIAEAVKVPLDSVLHLRSEWIRHREFNAAFTALSAYELTHHQVTTLVEKFGPSIVGMLEENPFLLAREVPGYGFKRIDQIARKVGTAKDHPERLRCGIIHCVHERLDQGDCWVEYDELVDQANELLIIDTMNARGLIETTLDELLEKKRLVAQPFSSRILIALPDIHTKEFELAELFREGIGANPHFAGIEDLDSWVAEVEPRLNPRQRIAVTHAMTHRLSLISGGAGSGKTFTVSAITSVYTAQGAKIVLCAPTGKAAKRLEQVVSMPASTIHRLLGYDGKGFAKGPSDLIDADLIVVDEFSMVDVSLAWHLFQAIDRQRTAVVLVGDHNQLPPVGPGNILRDLIHTKLVPMTILDQVMRQAGALKENCIAILRGEVRPTVGPEAGQPRPWYLCNHLTEPSPITEFLVDLYANNLEERLGFDLLTDVQLLTPTHKGPLGTRALNLTLQRLIQKKRFGRDVPAVPEGRRPKLYLGDKVIQTRNNYDIGVMNGTIGVVMDVGPKAGDYTIRFDGAPVEITAESGGAGDLQLAHALTIHKCVSGETLLTTDQGLIPIAQLADGLLPGETALRTIGLSGRFGAASTESISNIGVQPCTRVTTSYGFEITGSDDHKLLVADKDGLHWKEMSSLQPEDVMVLRRGTLSDHRDGEYQQVSFEDASLTIDEDVAWALGVLVGDGNQTDRKDYRVEVTKGIHEVILRFICIMQNQLSIRATVRRVANHNRFSVYFHSKVVRTLLERAGLGYAKAPEKCIPWSVLQGPRSVQRSFLQGLFDTDGGVNGPGVHFTTTSERLVREVQQLLFANGILSSRHVMRDTDHTDGWSKAWRLMIVSARDIARFSDLIGFYGEGKDFALVTARHCRGETSFKSNKGTIPFGATLAANLREELRQRDGRSYSSIKGLYSLLSRVCIGTTALNHHHLEFLSEQLRDIESLGFTGSWIAQMCRDGYFFDPVSKTERTEETVYDMLVPKQHSYTGNGFVNHNCQGSEFPCVVLIAHKAHSFMHHRNLLYTAVTRAQRSVIIIGDAWGIRNAAQKEDVSLRHTFLSILPDLEHQ